MGILWPGGHAKGPTIGHFGKSGKTCNRPAPSSIQGDVMAINPVGNDRPATPEEVIHRARSGDRGAFEELYRDHVGRVYALCLRLTGDPMRAEEATQDAFVRAWRKLNLFRGESSFGSWLYRLTTNVVFMEHRSRKRRESRLTAVPDFEQAEAPSGAAGGSLSGDAARFNPARQAPPAAYAAIDLERAVARLPEQARQVFVLHDVEGYRHAEIAHLLGMAVGTSKSQLHRARRALQAFLEGEE